MRIATLRDSLLLLVALTVSCSAYDFLGPEPLAVSEPVVEQPVYDEAAWDAKLKSIKIYQKETEEDKLLDSMNKITTQILLDSIKPVVVEQPKPEVKPEPKPKKEDKPVPTAQEFIDDNKTGCVLPDVKDVPFIVLDEPIKVVIHTTQSCAMCPPYIMEAKKLSKEFNIVVESHGYNERTKYGTWLNAFPTTEVVKGDKPIKVIVGSMTAEELKKVLDSIK